MIMLLEYKMFNDSVNKRQELVNIIANKINNNEEITREILANKMKVSIPWIDKARKQIIVCI